MFRKLCILLIFSKLEMINYLIYNSRMHNLHAIFAKFLDICKQMAGNLFNKYGNIPCCGVSCYRNALCGMCRQCSDNTSD